MKKNHSLPNSTINKEKLRAHGEIIEPEKGALTPRLIVVLGMHRSGTSAVTRALQVLGVHLGDHLMPPVENNNDKGFWEDLDINALNMELLNVLNNDWHNLTPITPQNFEVLRQKGFYIKALELLRQKIRHAGIFGIKDPRVAKLLPFWQEVFAHSGYRVSYVLTIRNPLSVAQSLAKRDGMAPEKSYLLWLEHVLNSLFWTAGTQRVMVDYDRLMQAPVQELKRMSEGLELPIDETELQVYTTKFLDQALQHNLYTAAALSLDEACPPLVQEIFMKLTAIASNQDSSFDQSLLDQMPLWKNEHDRLVTLLRYTDDLQARITDEALSISKLEQQVAHLNQLITERDGRIGSLNQAMAERDGQITNLSQNLADRENRINNLNHALAERDNRINDLNIALAQHNETLIERDDRIDELNQRITDKDNRIESLKRNLKNYDHQITELRDSTSWRLTSPLRFLSLLLRGKLGNTNAIRSRPVSLMKRVLSRQKINQENLPEGFDPENYLKLNPDLIKAGADPITHYLRHGRHEGRIFALPLPTLAPNHNFNDRFETILVVSHDASRTGAPILSLNVVQALVESYNVVVLLLGDGPLANAFQLAGASVITSSNLRGYPTRATSIISHLCETFPFKFALVNSIESRVVLMPLANCFVPAISLIHEFASYTRPRHAFKDALFWSTEVVFSAHVTKENAFVEYPELGERCVHILPQGRCLLPQEELNQEHLDAERNRIRHLIRPKSHAQDTLVILGAGYVQLRKGIDLFIECAARVISAPQGNRCRFVWIGKGFDPETDISYSVYLADQIRRAGLDKHVFFFDETTAIDAAYEEADLFLLSSRLDPLPNVAIDAMVHGLPVLCFNKSTGIADFLTDSGLGKECVAEFLDTNDMANKLLALVESKELRDRISHQCREASLAYFEMKDYIARLGILAKEASERIEQEKLAVQEILASHLYRQDFSCFPHLRGRSLEDEVRFYVRAWACGIDRRKPFPGFHPGIYLEQHGVDKPGNDPFVDYLKQNQPNGPWNCPVIITNKVRPRDLPNNRRVALHVHSYFPELLPEITTRLSQNRIRPDLFVSVAHENARSLVSRKLKDYKGKIAEIRIVPNRGRDIGPFLTAFGQSFLTDYEFVGHLHTKKSADVSDENMGKSWYRFLLENLLGGEAGAMADCILSKMKEDNTIGLVFPDDPSTTGWCDNLPFAETIAARMGIEKLPDSFNFPVGTMFWARTSALAPLLDLKLDWDDYPEEPLPYDGTLLHAIERLFSLVLPLSNSRYAVTNVPGITR